MPSVVVTVTGYRRQVQEAKSPSAPALATAICLFTVIASGIGHILAAMEPFAFIKSGARAWNELGKQPRQAHEKLRGVNEG